VSSFPLGGDIPGVALVIGENAGVHGKAILVDLTLLCPVSSACGISSLQGLAEPHHGQRGDAP